MKYWKALMTPNVITVVPAGMMNACDMEGNSALLRCAMQDSRDTVRRLLASKAAIERHLLDLSIQNNYGRTVLHYLVFNRDKHNIRLFLNILGRLLLTLHTTNPTWFNGPWLWW